MLRLIKTVSNVTTAYFFGKCAYKVYKKYKSIFEGSKDKAEAKKRFVEKYKAEYGNEPDDKMVEVFLSGANFKKGIFN